MSNFLQLCAKYQKDSGVTGSTITSVTNQAGIKEKITIWIADAANDVENKHIDWMFMDTDKAISVVSGTDEYSLTDLSITDMGQWDKNEFFINPETANYAKITNRDYREWRGSAARLGVKTSSQPTQVVIKPDNGIVFINKPDANYTVWSMYHKAPTKMTVNTSESSIPVRFEDIILHRASWYHGKYYGDNDMMQAGAVLYTQALKDLEANFLPDQQARATSANPAEDVVTRAI